jgi:chaperone modulatory protein CbpM
MTAPDSAPLPQNPSRNPAQNSGGDSSEAMATSLYSYQQVAQMTAISVTLVERFVSLSIVETEDDKLRPEDVARIAQLLRIRRDLGVNWVGAGIVLDLSREISQLKAQLRAYAANKNGLLEGDEP